MFWVEKSSDSGVRFAIHLAPTFKKLAKIHLRRHLWGMPNELKHIDEAFPELPPHFARLNKDGLVELVEISTGRTLLVQGHYRSILELKWERLVRIDTPQGPVFLEKGLNLDYTNYIKHPPYSKMLADLIAQEIVYGRTIVSACAKFNLEYATVKYWMREQEEFKELVAKAEQDRADYLFEEAIDKSRTADKKLEVDTLKWATEKANPEKYGAKTKISGDKNAPLTFMIGTGISRPGDPGYTPPVNQEQDALEAKQIKDVEELPTFVKKEET